MFQRVARVICIAEGLDPETVWICNDEPGELAIPAYRQKRFIDAARSVIVEMRAPTRSMIDAAIYPYRHGNTDEFNDIMRRTVKGYWQAMIDDALK